MRFRTHTMLTLAVLGIGAAPLAAQQQHTQQAAPMAAAAQLIPRDVLFGNPERTSARISPDGKQLAYLAPSNGVLNVWVRTLGGTDDRVVTADTKRGIRSYFWQGDNHNILYIQDAGGDENWRLYQTDITTRRTRDLTPYEKVRADVVAYDRDRPDEILVQMNRRDPRLFDVYRIDLKSGRAELDTENPGDVSDWLADNDLRVRAAQAQTPEGGTIVRVRDGVGSPWRDLVRWSADETLGGFRAFAPDNRSLWIATSLDANAARLLEYEIASGRSRVLAEDPQFDVSGVTINPRTNVLEAVGFARQRNEYVFLDPSVRSDFETLGKVRRGDVFIASRSHDDSKWIVGYDSDDAPVYYYLYDRPTRKATLLFSNNAQLEKYTLAAMKPIEYTARDGMKLYGYLTTPAGAEARNLPMVLFVHGGPWGRDMWGYDPYVQWLANRGYAVLQVNFRGSTGYGKKYVNAGDRQWAGAMHTDLLDGKAWAVGQGVADAGRVCIMGGSYGGYATLAGVAFAPDAFACGVDIVGPSNLNTLLATIPPYWTTGLAIFHKRMGDTEELLTAQSPLFKADQIRSPLLVGQGANDPRVNKAESDQIVVAMRKNGKDVEYYVFPDEGHGFARPENNKAFNAAVERFLAKYLGGRHEPATAEEMKLLGAVKQ